MSVYAFEWCDCVYESGYSVVSLHATKAGAYRAMRERLLREATEHREAELTYSKRYCGDRPMQFQAWCVRAIEVLP